MSPTSCYVRSVNILREASQKSVLWAASGKFVALDAQTNSFPPLGETGSVSEKGRGAMASTNPNHHLYCPQGARLWLCQTCQSSKNTKPYVSSLGSLGEIQALDTPIKTLFPKEETENYNFSYVCSVLSQGEEIWYLPAPDTISILLQVASLCLTTRAPRLTRQKPPIWEVFFGKGWVAGHINQFFPSPGRSWETWDFFLIIWQALCWG